VLFRSERALRVIREKVLQRHLPMIILDAEYQFDRHKLVFFFEADRRIDFRELVSDLFSLYKTRIWMQQVDTSVLPDHEIRMEIARAAGFLPSSYSRQDMEMMIDEDLSSVSPPRLGHHLTQALPSYARLPLNCLSDEPIDSAEDWSLSSPHSPADLARELAEQTFSDQPFSAQANERPPRFEESPFSEISHHVELFGSCEDFSGSMGPLLEGAWAYNTEK